MFRTITFPFILAAAFITILGFEMSATAEQNAGGFLGVACPKVVGMSGYIYKNYQPLRNKSGTLVAYAKSPTLLDNGGGSRRGNATIYDGNGKRLTSCTGKSCNDCRNGWRFKCAASTGAVRRAALKAGGPTIYFNVGGKCVRVPDAGQCIGSVKGLCNQTIK